ncbi:MAG: TonB-dependent receptor [Acidobacteria bacterium]|nr:TonB-dependent receptor [Acidobacteriota bacterium]
MTSLAQTTQGLIAGRVVDSQTGGPIAGAQVNYWNAATSETGATRTGGPGYYVLPMLSPGSYRIRVTDQRYQAQEVQELELPVAGRIDLNFHLRPLSDVWEAGQYRSVFLPGSKRVVTFFGPDVDTSHSGSLEATRGSRGALESTVSQVIDPAQVQDLPLAGRDVYTMLVTQPAVTADTTTGRGLGLSINGQRPTSSNFMLDGLENNNYLVSGPLTAIAPEAVQEYRVSISNFSAEYGRTAGYLANAITRSGGSQWHGIGYYYLKNDALNANGFQENLRGLSRPPLKEAQLGFQAGGPILGKSLFASSAFDHLRSRTLFDPQTIAVPTGHFDFTAPLARQLMQRFPAPAGTETSATTAQLNIAQPLSVDRSLALERVDYVPPSGRHRLMARLALARLSRPDFIWSPYKDFVSGLEEPDIGVAFSAVSSFKARLVNEARFGWSQDDLHWDRAHPEIPALASSDGAFLPGSPAFYDFRNHSRNWEAADNLVWAQGRHIVKFGGSFLLRRIDGYLTAGRDGRYLFDSTFSFFRDSPSYFTASLAREALSQKFQQKFQQPDFQRGYGYNQYSFFVQDTVRVTPRLAVNVGLRYEAFGAPRNTGQVKDGVVALGSGADFVQRLASAGLVFPQTGDQSLYQPDNGDWAPRFGFSYDLRGNARTVVRGGFGIFYDRPFDNLWQSLRNNGFVLATFCLQPTNCLLGLPTNYLAPIASVLPLYQGRRFPTNFPSPTLFEQDLRNGYVESFFFGVQQQITEAWSLEVNTLGALGRRLITTDQVNRLSKLNPLPTISYRGSQGLSDYSALTAVARYRAGRKQFQFAYTWSHSIDNQSDPLAGDFFDLSFVKVGSGSRPGAQAAFARQFDSRGDRGSSDFDQRHNLVFFSIWDLPAFFSASRAGALFRDWRFSQLAAFRSGFPYTVFVPLLDVIYNNRADVIDPARTVISQPAKGGKLLLNSSAFQIPEAGMLGNSGRNAFAGPGLYNIDISLSRSFPVRRLGESGKVTLRADLFNFLNHANLNNPDAQLGQQSTFGIATFGRNGFNSGFPALTPFNETPREIQLLLRLEF